MTKNEAIKAIRLTSSGTIANIIGCNKYAVIDAVYCDWILAAAKAPEDAFKGCNNVWDVVNVLQAPQRPKLAVAAL